MAVKKINGDLNVTGAYSQNGVTLLTTAPSEYDDTGEVYSAGDIAIHEGTIYRCIDASGISGTFSPSAWVEASYTSALTLEKSYSPVYGGSARFALEDGTVSYNDNDHVITMDFTGLPTAAGSLLSFIQTDAARAILWPSSDPTLGLFANVGFHDFVLDMTQFDPTGPTGSLSLSCFSPLCSLVLAATIGTGYSLTIAFTDRGASMYTLLKSLIEDGQYPAVLLVPVCATF